jgi:hypothetical protein
MSGTISPLSRTFSCNGAELTAETALPLVHKQFHMEASSLQSQLSTNPKASKLLTSPGYRDTIY